MAVRSVWEGMAGCSNRGIEGEEGKLKQNRRGRATADTADTEAMLEVGGLVDVKCAVVWPEM